MYNLNTLKKLSAPYNSLVAFKQANSEAYRSASAQGLLSTLYPSPTRDLQLSEAQVRERAARYSTKSQFKQGAKNHFKAAEELGILESLFPTLNGRGITWTLEMLEAAAKPYKTRTEFMDHEPNAYQSAAKRKLLNMVCKHMKPVVRWNLENLEAEAKKHKTRSEFSFKSSGAYQTACKKGLEFLDSICSHMT